MKAYQIRDLKNFMNKLLLSDCFDCFLLEEGIIVTANTFRIDGRIQKDFFTKEEQEEGSYCLYEFTPWKEIRPVCFHLIKGKRTPSFFKFVLLLSPANLENTLQKTGSTLTTSDVTAAFINLKFQNNKLLLTTGISYRTFTIDKSLDREWDALIKKFLKNHEIIFEEL